MTKILKNVCILSALDAKKKDKQFYAWLFRSRPCWAQWDGQPNPKLPQCWNTVLLYSVGLEQLPSWGKALVAPMGLLGTPLAIEQVENQRGLCRALCPRSGIRSEWLTLLPSPLPARPDPCLGLPSPCSVPALPTSFRPCKALPLTCSDS